MTNGSAFRLLNQGFNDLTLPTRTADITVCIAFPNSAEDERLIAIEQHIFSYREIFKSARPANIFRLIGLNIHINTADCINRLGEIFEINRYIIVDFNLKIVFQRFNQ